MGGVGQVQGEAARTATPDKTRPHKNGHPLKDRSMRLLRLIPVMLSICGLILAPAARADVTVDVNQGAIQPLPIAVPSFSGDSPYGAQIAGVITADLQRSGLFKPVDASSLASEPIDLHVLPNFTPWKALNAQALVLGQITPLPDGHLQVVIRLFDVFASQDLNIGTQFTIQPEQWRQMAHEISDAVYERLTGEKGYFNSRIVFIGESGPRARRVRRLMIMDQDGDTPSYLTEGPSQAFTPSFSPTSQEVVYMTLTDDRASLYLFNLATNRQETLGHFKGMVFAPRFSPDGQKVCFSVEDRGNIDIYVMDLRSRATHRLTTNPAIDTSPAFSPDGRSIVFNSDRGGSPQLYVMSADGSNQHRISFGDGRYTAPVWSPGGDLIAFTKQTGGTFHIGVMKPDGSGERILTTSYLDEGPTWAPNGRVLMFSREASGGQSHLWTVDVTGRVEEAEPYSGSASDPAWSPLLN